MGSQKVSSAAHPMVCFSECDLRELQNKRITYGKYGIGFSIEWARSKKISPVIYINQNSMAAKGLGNLLRARQNKLNAKLPENLRLPIIQLKCFAKNETGYNSYFNISNFNFKVENEWRYVPEKKDIGNGLISQDKSKYLRDQEKYNSKLLPYPLKFKEINIQVIYVSNEVELQKLSQAFPSLKEKIEVYNWNV